MLAPPTGLEVWRKDAFISVASFGDGSTIFSGDLGGLGVTLLLLPIAAARKPRAARALGVFFISLEPGLEELPGLPPRSIAPRMRWETWSSNDNKAIGGLDFEGG